MSCLMANGLRCSSHCANSHRTWAVSCSPNRLPSCARMAARSPASLGTTTRANFASSFGAKPAHDLALLVGSPQPNNAITPVVCCSMTSRDNDVSHWESVGHQSYPIDHNDEFDQRLSRALENPRLRQNLSAFQQGWRAARDHVADEIDFPTLQSRMKRAKSAVTANLEAYL